MKILTASQMREVDRKTVEEIGIPGLLLMENAGIHIVQIMEERFEHLTSLQVAIVCGRGNNGGDGMVAARHLYMRGIVPHVFLICRIRDVKGDARRNLDILRNYGDIPIIEIPAEKNLASQDITFMGYQLIVDALLGTGIREPAEGLYARVIDMMNEAPAPVVAVDIPSGLFADEYRPVEHAVYADVTVTFTAPKPGLLLGEAISYTGDLFTVSIGTPDTLLDIPEHHLNVITNDETEPFFFPRKKDTHKGNYGHVLLAGGGRGKTGAIKLAGMAALRCGAGLVTCAVPDRYAPFVSAEMPELMTESLPAEWDGFAGVPAADHLLGLLTNKDLLVLGPGMGIDQGATEFIHSLLPRLEVPAVVDADALTCIAKDISVLEKVTVPLVLTPHPGEMGRLTGRSTLEVQENRETIALELARKYGVYVILKGFRTVLADPSGQIWINMTGNPGMATAGAGDVLAGILGALCARINHQNPDAWVMACSAGIHLHGMAGDLAAEALSEESVVAGDILRHIPVAIRQLRGEEE